MYDKESLRKINSRYCGSGRHWINDYDVEKANSYVRLIESTRSTTWPKPGDILILIDKYGDYYPHAHIEKEALGLGGNVCEHAYVPFIHPRKNGITCSASGGAWQDVPFDKMIYVGKAKKTFCDWGSCGACADGAIEFEAEVSVWKYTDPNQQTPGFTEKDYEKFYVSDSGANSKYTRETGYRFHVKSRSMMNYTAFKDRAGLDAWLLTFRGKLFDRGEKNTAIVWTWKQERRHVTPDEFDAMKEPEDSMLFNGAVRKCKRIYDEENHTVITCFVWYWDEPGDWRENAMKQNRIRDERYTFPWNTPEYIVARAKIKEATP